MVFALHRPLLKDKPLQLVNGIREGTPLVYADENRVQQILHNFIDNAIKFTDEGKIEISSVQENDLLAISIQDNGVGIPEHIHDNIFKPFEQFDHDSVYEYKGTGLGLSVSKQLVELHGGNIEVSSMPGEGSTFTFTLPISDFPLSDKDIADSEAEVKSTFYSTQEEEESFKQDPITPASTIEVSDSQVKILVVDDEPVNRIVLENHLTLQGYEVTQAINGPQALEIIDNGKVFDLVILDIMMPKMSGIEVCQKLRSIYHPSELPIIMLTAKNRINDLVKGFNVGANDYLTKPFSKDELMSRIKTHLNLHRIHQATDKFVPTEFLKAVGREFITDVQLGDHSQKKVTVFFSDIRGYTNLAEQMTPEENFKFVNAYVGRMGPIIPQNKGFVNQYLGDGIMAIFPEKLEHALNAAIQMQKKIKEYNSERFKKKRIPLHVGMGMHTGSLIMGIIGDKSRNEPATISDTVNTASRMEGLTKHYGANIIVSEDCINTLQNKKGYHFRFLENVQVKGKVEIIGAYECIDGDEEEVKLLKIQHLPLFKEGLRLFYEKEFGEATAVFSKILKINKRDYVAQYFMNKSAKYTHLGVPEDWQGIERI